MSYSLERGVAVLKKTLLASQRSIRHLARVEGMRSQSCALGAPKPEVKVALYLI